MAHIELSELADHVTAAGEQVTVGATYQHYRKADIEYRVIHLGLIEATQEVAVMYQRQVEPKLIWIRPLSDFLATVTTEDGRQVQRFQKVK